MVSVLLVFLWVYLFAWVEVSEGAPDVVGWRQLVGEFDQRGLVLIGLWKLYPVGLPKCEVLVRSFDDFKRAVVRCLEWGSSCVSADKHEFSL